MSYLDHKDDNYLFPLDYYGYPAGEDGFSHFQFEGDNKWYFGYFEHGHLILRGEGYESEAAREHGIEAVKKYMGDDANYHVLQLPNGRWVLDLKAPNHKEIARTAQYYTKEEALAQLPSARAAREAVPAPKPRAKDDDYLACKEYENKPRSGEHPEFTAFDESGEHYFALVDKAGNILLRGEGYQSKPARKHGMESVLRYKGERDLYLVKEHLGYHFVILRAPNHHEIARSCPKSEAEALALINLLVGAPHARAKDDDYLKCKEYENRPRSEEHPEFTVFDERGEHYFALVDKGGEVLLRGEGYESVAARKHGMESVLKYKGDKANYKVEEHLGYHFVILRAPNHHEIARSCPKSEAGALALIALLTGTGVPVAEPVAMAAAPAAAKKGGFNWWWLLLPLLLVLLFLLWRSCNKTDDAAPVSGTEIETSTTTTASSPIYAADHDCAWKPVLFETDQAVVDARGRAEVAGVVAEMQSNPNYRALFIGFTDSTGSQQYNVELSQRRADAVKAVAVEMGIDASRISTREEDEHNPVATNKNEMGRHFNRRVVMYVLNADNHLVCRQVRYNIPEYLKPEE